MAEIERRLYTPVFRLAFPALFEPREFRGQTKYGLEAVFDSDADLSKMKKVAEQVAREKWGKKLPAKFRSPFINGNAINERRIAEDKNPRPELENATLMRFRSTNKPDICKRNRHVKAEESEVYSGRLARASVYCFAYDDGVTFLLNNVQIFEEDGVCWGGAPLSAANDFNDEISQPSEAQAEFSDEDDIPW